MSAALELAFPNRPPVPLKPNAQSSGGIETDKELEQLVQDDYSGLKGDAAQGVFPRIIATIYKYDDTTYAYTAPGPTKTRCDSYAAHAVQLRKKI
ncbi:uncharacterized protein RHO25_002010 [Cercospora beticola]|nr:hypothetical protein RHO25_002010 [Cercospora beticola]CAK1354170.1 unnamed protein product [Cercospora beticola]